MSEQPKEIEGLSKIGSDVASSETLKSDKKEQNALFGEADRRRNEEAKQTLHSAFIWLLRVAAFLFVIVLVVRGLHFIIPDSSSSGWIHGWLTETQLQNIDKAFFSGALGALLTRHIKQVWPN